MKKTFFLLFSLIFQFSFSQESTELKVQNFPVPVFTNSNLSLVILGSAWYNSPLEGDEIAVIETDSEIVGNSIVLQGHNGLAIWGDNPLTNEKDGLFVGERFSILHWSKSTDTYSVYSNFSFQTGTSAYIKDGFTIINSLGKAVPFTRTSEVYYHIKSVLSEKTSFSFYIQQNGVYSLSVTGNDAVFFELENVFFKRGYHSFDSPDLIPSGNYSIGLSSENLLVNSKVFSVE